MLVPGNTSEYICLPLYMPILIYLKCLKRLCVYFIVLTFKKENLKRMNNSTYDIMTNRCHAHQLIDSI